LAPNTLTRNKKVVPLQENKKSNEIVVGRRQEEYVRVPKSEYEAFKTRLHCIETKITQEFNTVKLNAVKAELGRREKKKFDGPEQVENKFHETLQEVEKYEDSERKTEQLAKRLSRELKIRPQLENPVIRSPSARKIGSLRRRQEKTTRLSRNQSWHLGPSALNAKVDESPEKNKTLTSSLSFYPKPNLKRARLVDSALIQETQPLPIIPQSTEKVVPEKPVRKSINLNANQNASEAWMPATDFFNDTKNISSHEDEIKVQDIMFKTPNRPNKRFIVANEIDINKTPMLPPKMTPNRRCTPMSDKKTPSMNRTMMLTPSMNEGREGRASIIQIRNQNAGMVAQKAKLFDDLSADLTKSVDRSIKIPRVIINKKLENVKNMHVEMPQNHVPSNSSHSPRRSSRSPGINRRMNLRTSNQSPVLKTIKENAAESRNNRVNLLKPDVLNEIASPRNRKVLSQSNNTPRRNSKTPKNSSSKKHRTPRSSSKKSMRRHHISFD